MFFFYLAPYNCIAHCNGRWVENYADGRAGQILLPWNAMSSYVFLCQQFSLADEHADRGVEAWFPPRT